MATVGIVTCGGIWLAVWAATGLGTPAIAYVFLPAGSLVTTVAVGRLVRGGTLDAVAARFWRGLLVAFSLVGTGYSWLAVDMLTHTDAMVGRTMPLPAAACVAVGFGVAMWAVGRVPIGASPPTGPERRRITLDRGIALFGCATVLWHFGLAPMFTAPERWSNQATVLFGLAFLLTIGGVTKASYVMDGPVDRTAMRLIASTGLIAAVVAVLAVWYGRAAVIPAQAVVMPLADVLATFAVLAQWRQAGRPPAASRRASTLLPYLAVLAVDVPLVAVATGPLLWTGRLVVLSAVVVSILVMVRQWLVFRDNARLLRERRLQEERLQHEVTHDGLTGLANRTLFRDRLAGILPDGGSAAVLLIDLDDFKTVNDSLGHDVGDRLLVSIAEVLRAQVGAEDLAVRLGGDEFAVLTDGTTDADDLARRILDELGRPISEHRLLVQASIGVAAVPAGETPDAVLRHADVAMYAAKQRGKAGHMWYAPGMEAPVLAHIQLGGELRRALDEGEFRVFYQPVVSLLDGRVLGAEALVRWQHPVRGMVPPVEFIPAAERTGLIVPLGRFVLGEACRQMAAWIAEFGPDAVQKMAPNVSARQLHDPDFVPDVVAALAEAGLPTDRLMLELTESAVLRGPQVSRALHELAAMGVTLALDDFGTGESSLSLLQAFPVSIVKLDKSFVDGIDIDDGDPAARDAREAVARAVVQLAGALRLDTIAEGIENATQAERLRELGYTQGQGYHLARPMPAEDMSRLLARQRSMAASA